MENNATATYQVWVDDKQVECTPTASEVTYMRDLIDLWSNSPYNDCRKAQPDKHNWEQEGF